MTRILVLQYYSREAAERYCEGSLKNALDGAIRGEILGYPPQTQYYETPWVGWCEALYSSDSICSNLHVNYSRALWLHASCTRLGWNVFSTFWLMHYDKQYSSCILMRKATACGLISSFQLPFAVPRYEAVLPSWRLHLCRPPHRLFEEEDPYIIQTPHSCKR